MKKISILFIISLLSLLLSPTPSYCQQTAVFNFFVEIELTNDQGDLPTRDYLKNYGTKGKKKGIEFIYQVSEPFILSHFEKAGHALLKMDTLCSVKCNAYGYPFTQLPKAIESGIADRYIRIHLKDISMLSFDGVNSSDPQNRQRKIAGMRCRYQVYGQDRALLAESVGEFHTGERIEHPDELGVDLRRNDVSEFEQELKVYEVCSKMAILRALSNLKW